MRRLRAYFAAVALLLAIGTAYASTILAVEYKSKRNRLNNTCVQESMAINCDETSANICQDASWIYYKQVNCVEAFKKP